MLWSTKVIPLCLKNSKVTIEVKIKHLFKHVNLDSFIQIILFNC